MAFRAPRHSFISPRIRVHAYQPQRTTFRLPVEARPDWTLLALEQGQFRASIDSGPELIWRRGDILLCPPHVPFARVVIQTISFHFVQFVWSPPDPSSWSGHWTIVDTARFESTCEHWRRLATGTATGDNSVWRDHLLADLLQLRENEAARQRLPGGRIDRLMHRAAERLGRNIAESLPLHALARELGLSPFQLSRRFRAEHGIGPSAYRTRARLNQARHLLRETDWKTERIADATGFRNSFYFSRVFSREYGCPPSEFRRINRM